MAYEVSERLVSLYFVHVSLSSLGFETLIANNESNRVVDERARDLMDYFEDT